MPFPKLSPLQSRFVGSLVATALLVLLYFLLTTPQSAYAEPDSVRLSGIWHDTGVLQAGRVGAERAVDSKGDTIGDAMGDMYEAEFLGLDRGIIGRAPPGVKALSNNSPELLNISPGDTQYWQIPNATLFGPFSGDTPGLPTSLNMTGCSINRNAAMDPAKARTLYISVNTCIQPMSNVSTNTAAPPPLKVYISTTSSNQAPGPDVNDKTQIVQAVEQGFMSVSVGATGDTFVAVVAPSSTDFGGVYNYEIAASIDAPYHCWNPSWNSSDRALFILDSDSSQALLVTNNLTDTDAGSQEYDAWSNISPPFVVFAHNLSDPRLQGLQRSYCGLNKIAQIASVKDGRNTNNVNSSMTIRGQGNKPKEQFLIKGLSPSSSYSVFLAMQGNSTNSGAGVVGGGGTVWPATNLTSKSDENCQVIFNLKFCDEVAYAVPSNPSNSSILADWYDSHAEELYQNFNKSLQQIPCNTTSSAQYSLARNCTDCAAAYKQWLCAVTIPRCEDFSSNKSYLVERNIAQKFINGSDPPVRDEHLLNSVWAKWSRNQDIDKEIRPGPYKEVLPCKDLCYSLVQSCPAALQFDCPSGRDLARSYGERSSNGEMTCSYLGAAVYLSRGYTKAPPAAAASFFALGLSVWASL